MGAYMRVNLKMGRNMVWGGGRGRKVQGSVINMKVCIVIMSDLDRGCLLGKMGKLFEEIISMICKVGMVKCTGMMEPCTKEIGKTVFFMVTEYLLLVMEKSKEANLSKMFSNKKLEIPQNYRNI